MRGGGHADEAFAVGGVYRSAKKSTSGISPISSQSSESASIKLKEQAQICQQNAECTVAISYTLLHKKAITEVPKNSDRRQSSPHEAQWSE